MEYLVRFEKEWTESGYTVIEARHEEEAMDIAAMMLADGDPEIEWDSDAMDPGQDRIVGLEEIK